MKIIVVVLVIAACAVSAIRSVSVSSGKTLENRSAQIEAALAKAQ